MLVFFLATFAAVNADAPAAKCNSSAGFQWALNSKQQDPCTVASYLGSVCNKDGVFTVPALAEHTVYVSPSIEQVNNCVCETVFYNLLSLCSACQLRDFERWSYWSTNCTTTNATILIPPLTAVPGWAFQTIENDKFNVTLAQLESNLPESTSVIGAAPTSLENSSRAGPIAGGVVGSVVLLLFISAGCFFWRRRKQPTLMVMIEPFSSKTNPQTYNPSDPSTFPIAVERGSHDLPVYLHPAYRVHHGKYTGVAEPYCSS